MKKIVILIIGFLGNAQALFAQHAAKMPEMHHHAASFSKPNAHVANAIIWVSVIVVAVTLYLTLKYLFFPRESDPNHIKNIVKNEGF